MKVRTDLDRVLLWCCCLALVAAGCRGWRKERPRTPLPGEHRLTRAQASDPGRPALLELGRLRNEQGRGAGLPGLELR